MITYNNHKLIPSTQNISATKITKDSDGNSIIIGEFLGQVDFDMSTSVYNVTSEGTYFNNFILKLSATGSFISVKTFAGSTTNAKMNINDIIVDNSNIYITGSFFGTVDFDPTSAILNKSVLAGSFANTTDFFIGKYDLNMNPIWVQTSGSIADDSIKSFALDASGNIYAVGIFGGTVDFDPSAATIIFNASGGSGAKYDGFYWKLAADGNFISAFKIGGIYYDDARKIIIDDQNVLIMGVFSATIDFNPGTSINNMTASNGRDTYVLKLDLNQNYISTFSIGCESLDLEKDSNGNLFIEGLNTSQYEDFDPLSGVAYLPVSNSSKFFILKLSSSYAFNWVKSFADGNNYGNSEFMDFQIDAENNIYTLGRFKNIADFDPSAAVYNLPNSTNANYSTFLQKLDNDGNLLYAGVFRDYVKNYDFLRSMYISPTAIVLVGSISDSLVVDPNQNYVPATNSSGTGDAIILYLNQSTLGNGSFVKNTLNISPNPTTNYIKLNLKNSLENGNIKIISITGQTVLEESNLSGLDFNFDVSQLTSGLYLLQISDSNNSFNSKFIKE